LAVCKTAGTHSGNSCILTREVGIRMNRVAHVADQKAMPLACPVMVVPEVTPLRMRVQALAARTR
jgi:hypothetical protein